MVTSSLLYADDIVLLVRGQVELQVMLDMVGECAMKCKFINSERWWVESVVEESERLMKREWRTFQVSWSVV